MSIAIHTWKLTGLSPLLHNNPVAMMGGSSDGMSSGKKVYKDEDEAEIRTYKTDDGLFFHPAEAFRAAMLCACTGRKINRRSAKSIIAGSVFPAEHRVILIDPKSEKPIKKYGMHKCRVVVGKAGILRVRPMYEPWACKLALEIDSDFITDTQVITDLLNIAGRIVGIGDNRPDTSKGRSGVGTFGRFQAEAA